MVQYRWAFRFCDLLALWLSVVAGYFIRFESGMIPAFTAVPEFSVYLTALGYVSPLYFLILQSLGNYDDRRGKLSEYEIQTLFRSMSLFYFVCFAATFFIRNPQFSRITLLVSASINFILCVALRAFVARMQLRDWKAGKNTVSVLLVGKDQVFLHEISTILQENPHLGYRVAGIRPLTPPPDLQGIERLFVAGGDLTFSEIADLVLGTFHAVRVDAVPGDSFLLRNLPFKEHIGRFPVIPISHPLLPNWNLFAKRIMDVMIAGMLLVAFFPFLAAVYGVLRWLYGSPALFRQVRVGQNGHLFTLYKFRTMKLEAHQQTTAWIEEMRSPNFKLKEDPRVLGRFARFLRRTSADELPQLWNVLRGQMSLVGPRPAPVEFVKNYSSVQKIRLSVPPGITGLQQVNCRGTESMDRILGYDIRYLSEQSLWLDMKILLRTIPVVILGKGIH